MDAAGRGLPVRVVVASPRGMTGAALLLCTVVTAGCGGPGGASPAGGGSSATSGTSPSGSSPLAGRSPAPDRIEIAPGVRLAAGPGGVLPVSLRWVVVPEAYPEAVAVADGVVYVAAGSFQAFAVSDGAQLWSAAPPDGHGLAGSGSVVIGARGADRVGAWAPHEFDLTVERSTGSVVRFSRSPVGGRPPQLQPFPESQPERFGFELDLERIVARDERGSVAWSITVDEPMVDELPPVGVPGGVLVTTSSGHLVLLDHR